MATIGIGDFHPDAANLAESLVAIVFMSVGMVLLAALLIAFAYHFQVIFFVHLRGWLLRMANARK
jgi:flagellar biosynthesis protein FliP